MRKLLLAVYAAGFVSLMSGCQVVKPWQRGHLADYTMRPERNPQEDMLREHVFFTREAAAGGRGVGGGGCN
ncbi:MAG: DUF4266 domain-containing protein [Verrucomicrobia bacterium]|nr:DUF4266 domain-containing protein [Verrucomicrobiota bacterium]MBU1910236.1 DUF4266 domain-containing protein [Verrucomicrobiota bacterium]